MSGLVLVTQNSVKCVRESWVSCGMGCTVIIVVVVVVVVVVKIIVVMVVVHALNH